MWTRQYYPHNLAQSYSLVVLPIEERLLAITVEPSSIVKLKVMAISMPGVNLLNSIRNYSLLRAQLGETHGKLWLLSLKIGSYSLEPMLQS